MYDPLLMEYKYLLELMHTFSSKEAIDSAVDARGGLKKNGKNVGFTDEAVTSAFRTDTLNNSEITLDIKRLTPEALAIYGVAENNKLSLRERLIIDAAVMAANHVLIEKHREHFVPTMDDDKELAVAKKERPLQVRKAVIGQLFNRDVSTG